MDNAYPSHLTSGDHYISTYYFTPKCEAAVSPLECRPLSNNVSHRIIDAAAKGDIDAQLWIADWYNRMRAGRKDRPMIKPVSYGELTIESYNDYHQRVASLS